MFKKAVQFLVLLLAAAILSGCTYSFDFALEGDLINSAGEEWEVVAGEAPAFSADGAHLSSQKLKSPRAFSGDYTVEYYFKPVYSDGSFIDVMSFTLQDVNYMGLFVYEFPDLPPGTIHYAIEWGNPFDFAGAAANPFIVANEENVLKVQKIGNRMHFWMNEDDLVAEIIIPPAMVSEFWAPAVAGTYNGNIIGDGLYIKRIKVTYSYGNSLLL